MVKKHSSTEEFKGRAYKKHNGYYTYEKVEYIDAKTNVLITCPKHGDFPQTPNHHLSGQGCKKCYHESKIIKQENFIERTFIIHSGYYTYNNVIYKNMDTNILITCPKHGDFPQRPDSHLEGKGCPNCGLERQSLRQIYSKEEFEQLGYKKHNGYYTYEKTEYVDAKTDVFITCPKHGAFLQKPVSHLQGHGCGYCANEKRAEKSSYSEEEFKQLAYEEHNGYYTYNNTIYINSITDVLITCPIHGDFPQTPVSHLQGHGCWKCAGSTSKGESEWIASFNNPNIIKPPSLKINGKTYHPDGYDTITNTVYEYNGDFYHGNPIKYNPEDINPKNKISYGQLYQ
jgi:hypothetical protein